MEKKTLCSDTKMSILDGPLKTTFYHSTLKQKNFVKRTFSFEILDLTRLSTLYFFLHDWLWQWHLQIFEDPRRVNYPERYVRQKRLPVDSWKSTISQVILSVATSAAIYLLKHSAARTSLNHAHPSSISVPLIFINLIRVDHSWLILRIRSPEYNYYSP